MKIKSQPKHKHFYQRWLPMLTGLVVLSYLGQIISAVTESMPIFVTLHDSVSSFFGENGYVFWSCASVTLLVVILLEVSLRATLKDSFKFLWEKVNPKGVSNDLKEEIKSQGLEKLDKYLKYMTVAFSVILLFIIQFISWKGSYDTTDFLTEEVVEVDSIAIMDSVIMAHESKVNGIWSKDSLMICSQFDKRIEAIRSSFESEAEAHRTTANKYTLIDPVKYASRISNENRRALKVEAKGNKDLLSIENEKSDSISSAYAHFKSGLEESKLKGEQLAQLAIDKYRKDKTERDKNVSGNGVKLAYGTVLGSLILLVSLFFQTAVNHGSEKRETTKESPLKYYPNYIQLWLRSRKERFLYKRYGKIFSFKRQSPPPPLPKEEEIPVDFSETTTINPIQIAAKQEDAKRFVLPQKTALVAVANERTAIGFGDKEAHQEVTYKVVNRTIEHPNRTDSADIRTEDLVTVEASKKSCKKDVVCACGCGRSLRGKRKDAKYFDNTCRARAAKNRKK